MSAMFSMHQRRLPPPLFVLALVSMWSSAALAAPTAKDKQEAKQLATDGHNALTKAHFRDAEMALRRSAELDPNPQTNLALAQALLGQHKLIEASKILHAVVDGAPPKGAPAKKAVDAAKKTLADVEGRIPWIQVTVAGPAPGNAKTLVDGQETDATSEVPIDPGEHVVAAEADGFERIERKVTIEEGGHQKLNISLTREAGSASPAAATHEDQPTSGGGTAVPAVIAFGVGAVGLGIGAVFGVMAFNEKSKAADSRDEYQRTGSKDAQLRFQNALSTSKTNGTVSTVGFIAGGVGVAAGVVLLLTLSGSSKPSAPTEADKAYIRPWASPDRVGVAGAF
jgi:hypothetical protein